MGFEVETGPFDASDTWFTDEDPMPPDPLRYYFHIGRRWFRLPRILNCFGRAMAWDPRDCR